MNRALAVALLLGCGIAVAQTADPCLERTFVVNVEDGQWHVLSNLKQENFFAKLRDDPVQVTSVTSHTKPKRLIFLLDTSGSMSDQRTKTLQLVEQMIAISPKETAVALYTFSTVMDEKVTFSDSPELIAAKLNAMWRPPPKPMRTALIDAIYKSIESLDSPSSEDVIFAVTDGGDNSSKHTQNQLRELLLASSVRLTGILLWEFLAGALAESSGGDFLILSPLDIPRDLSRSPLALHLMGQLVDGYKLTVKLPYPTEKNKKWKLELANVDSALKKKFHVVYPRELAACAQP
jgi:hypothetical protein